MHDVMMLAPCSTRMGDFLDVLHQPLGGRGTLREWPSVEAGHVNFLVSEPKISEMTLFA